MDKSQEQLNEIHGLIVKLPWIGLILSGAKTWEIRGSNTRIRGKIALIKSGTGLIYGTVELIGSRLLTLAEYQGGEAHHCIPDARHKPAPYERTWAWELRNPIRYSAPIPYQHPRGAVIWVCLDLTRETLLAAHVLE